jgi:hypothetical protein
VWREIKDIALKTVMAAVSNRNQSRPCRHCDNGICGDSAGERKAAECESFCSFKTYAIDFMIDRDTTPKLIEVNDQPGFSFQECDPDPINWRQIASGKSAFGN